MSKLYKGLDGTVLGFENKELLQCGSEKYPFQVLIPQEEMDRYVEEYLNHLSFADALTHPCEVIRKLAINGKERL